LSREIRETLQILLMKEKNEIELIKEKTSLQVEEMEFEGYKLCKK